MKVFTAHAADSENTLMISGHPSVVLTIEFWSLESVAFVVTPQVSACASEQGTPVKFRDGQAAVCRLQLNSCVRHSFQKAIVPDVG